MPPQPHDALLRDLYQTGVSLPLSFELFPPRSDDGRERLRETVQRLADTATDGFSVTMGAGGSSGSGTHETARTVQGATGRPVTAHLTALGLSRADVRNHARQFWQDGITRILALRGDRPQSMTGPLTPGYANATELVAALRSWHDFEISVAAHPEKHPEAASLDEDIDHLKEKLDAGASRAICQFVLDPEAYGRFLDRCERHGIDAPIVAGLMPLENWPRIRSFAQATGTAVPAWLDRLFADTADTPEVSRLAGVAATVEQARRLIAYGAPALHVYTLNRWQIPLTLARLLGHRDSATDPAAPGPHGAPAGG